jgi:hypothetical protein
MANKLYILGSNDYGQFGNGISGGEYTTTYQLIDEGNDWDKVSISNEYVLGLRNGELWAWGYNNGRFGNGTTTNSNVPIKIEGYDDWEDIAAGGSYACGIRNGKIYVTGGFSVTFPGFGEYVVHPPGLGDNGPVNVWTEVLAEGNFVKIKCGQDPNKPKFLALRDDFTLWGAGNLSVLNTSNSPTTSFYASELTQVTRISDGYTDFSMPINLPIHYNDYSDYLTITDEVITDFAIGENETFIIVDNKLYYSRNTASTGSAGSGQDIEYEIPKYYTQTNLDEDWEKVFIGAPDLSFAIKTDGTLWSCGYNQDGSTGLNTDTGTTFNFTQVGTESGWESISAAASYWIDDLGVNGIKNGQLYAWGRNYYNGTGLGETNTLVPTLIEEDKSFFYIDNNNWFNRVAIEIVDPPNLSNASLTIYRENNSVLIKENEQSEWLVNADLGEPEGEILTQWQKSNNLRGWFDINNETTNELILDNNYDQKYIRLKVTVENNAGQDTVYSNHIYIRPPYEQISLIEKLPPWKFILYDYQGQAIGELIDIHNINLDLGINKNPSLSFDTTLNSPLGQVLGNGLDIDDPLFFITAWRFDPYETNTNNKYKLQFSGIVFSMEEKGTDNNPTIGITAVGPYYQLTKRIANDAKDDGRRQSGIKPTDDKLLLFVADSINNRIMVYDASDGSYVRKWGEFGTDPGQFWNPFGVDTSENKYVYVADKNNNRIQKFDLEGNFILEWNEVEDEDNLLEDPVDVAVDPITREVWVADQGNKQLVKYTANGEFVFKVSAQTNCPMDTLSSVYVDFEGNVYLTDKTSLTTNPNNQGVYKVKPTGEIIVETTDIITSTQKKFAIDGSGQTYWVNGAGQLRRGSGRPKLTSKATTMLNVNDGESLTIGPDKSIYFLRANSTIYKYNAANNISLQFGTAGNGNGQTSTPRSLALARDGGKDSIELVADIIEYSNTENNGGLIDPPASWSPAPTVFIEPGSLGGYRTISSIVEEFNDNYEWRIEPDFSLDDGIKLGSIKMEPVLGENKFVNDSIVFEYGFGKHNVNEYTIKKSIENLANIINYPAADQIPYNISGTSPELIEKIGVFEDVVSGNILSKDLRKNLIDLHLYYRTSPRTMVEITPSRSDTTGPDDSRTPIPLLQYHLGDVIGIGIQENGEYRIDPVEARIYDIQIQIDSEGQETATLNLYFDA